MIALAWSSDAPGANPQPWLTSTSTCTSEIGNTGAAPRPVAGLVIPFPRITATPDPAQYNPRAAGAAPDAPTATANEQDRFLTPASLLMEALLSGARMVSEAPAKYRFPTPAAVQEAIIVLTSLPADVDIPEPAVEPTGTILWSWSRNGDFLVIGVDGSGQLQLSYVIDGAEDVDTVALAGSIAPEVLELLARFRVSHA